MAAPKKYKTNTLKSSSPKKSSVRTTAKKRPNSRVGSTKLAKKSFLKPWMALPIIAVVALAGYAIVQFSQASSYGFYKTCGDLSGGSTFYIGVGGWGSGKKACTKLISGNGAVVNTTGLTLAALQKSSKVCAVYYGASDTASVRLYLNGTYLENSNWAVSPSSKGKSTTFCGDIGNNRKSSGNVATVALSSGGSVAVQAIYGTWSGSGTPVRDTRPVLRNCGQVIQSYTKFKIIDGGRTRVNYKQNRRQNCDSGGHSTGTSLTKWFETSRGPNPNYRPQCNPSSQVTRNKTCVDATVYAKQVSCPKIDGKQSKSYTKRYKGKNAYSCKLKIPNQSYYKYAAPRSVVCFNSTQYEPKSLSEKWRYCGRRSGE